MREGARTPKNPSYLLLKARSNVNSHIIPARNCFEDFLGAVMTVIKNAQFVVPAIMAQEDGLTDAINESPSGINVANHETMNAVLIFRLDNLSTIAKQKTAMSEFEILIMIILVVGFDVISLCIT
jgi:hypothetical protein